MTTHQNSEVTPVDPSAVVAPAKKSKVRRNIILAGSAAGLVGIGSTLAANINLNSGENVEFGQGVARTTACDEDGFNINPVTFYDNELSIFRLDYVEVTGLNLTPVGTGWDDGDLNGIYSDTATAKTAHPGQYFDGVDNEWKRTCDGVVLDFKAFTDDVAYGISTADSYASNIQDDTSSPIAWAQYEGNVDGGGLANFGFAVVFNTSDDNLSHEANYAGGDPYGYTPYTYWDNLDHSTAANSSFIFESASTWSPDAASISKITVASMATFPSDYYVDNSGGIGLG